MTEPLASLRTTNGWTDRTRIVLTPIAAPSVLGLYGFAGATIILATHLAGWWGDASSTFYIAPFAFAFGGIAQLLAGMWAYRARDAIGTAMHGMWGAFWIAYGILYGLFAAGILAETNAARVAEAWWFIALAAITAMGTLAALAVNAVLTGVLGTLSIASALAAIGLGTGTSTAELIGAWFFIVSAILAWYLASAMMLAEAYGKVVLPLGKYKRAANVPGHSPAVPISYPEGMPGARIGQ